MSFILDALRKSDAERQRAATPGLADVRYARRPSRRNIWVPILVVVLLANIVFMGMQWFGRQPETRNDGTGAPALREPDAGTPPSVPPGDVPAADNVRPLARENEFDELRPAYTPEQSPPVAPPPARAAASGPAPGTESAPEAESASAAGTAPAKNPYPRITPANTLPSIEQAVGNGRLNVPALNLDLHVYSDKPASRFVVINGHRYGEGDKLAEGPVIESITADGVILDSQGMRFTLARK